MVKNSSKFPSSTCLPALFVQVENFVTGKYRNLVSYTDMPVGGHFAAYEQPKLLFSDIVQFVALVEKNKTNKEEL